MDIENWQKKFDLSAIANNGHIMSVGYFIEIYSIYIILISIWMVCNKCIDGAD